MGFFGDMLSTVGNGSKRILGGLHDTIVGGANAATAHPIDDERKKLQGQQAAASGAFADQAQQGYGQLGAEAQARRDYLRRIASGQESISQEQLRQGLQQQLAQQRSMAASASPQNAAMAARAAMMNQARIGAASTGQAALAGMQERRDAEKALADMILQQRGQDLQGALGGRSTAVQGYGTGMQPEKSWAEKYGGALGAFGQILGLGGK